MAYTVFQRIQNPREEGRTWLSTRRRVLTARRSGVRGPLERRFHTMTQRTSAEIGFVKLSDSDFEFENPEQDIRGKDVYDADGEQIGSVDDLYIDRQERKVRFLEVGAGGFLGIGEKHLLVPVESVTEVGEDRVILEPGRREKVAGSPPFDTTVVALTTTYKRRRQVHDDYCNTDPSRTPPRV